MITSSNKKSKSKKRPLHLLEKNDPSNQLCGACQLPLVRVYGNAVAKAKASSSISTSNGGSNDQCNARMDAATVNLDGNVNAMTRQVTDNSTSHAIITCSNMFEEVKCCKSSQTSDASPHYHFSCIEKKIHPKSKLYSDVCQYIQEQDDESKRKRLKKTFTNANANAKGGDLMYQPGTMPNKIPLVGQKHVNASLTGSTTSSTGSYSTNESLHSNTSSGRNTPTYKRSLMKNPFVCGMCDMQGSAQYLAEYFYNFRSEKCGYYRDEEAVDPIRPISDLGDDDIGSSGMAREHGFVKYLMTRQEDYVIGKPHKSTEVSMHCIRNILQHTRDGQTKSSFDFSTLNASHLIGQPVRLFCNISKSYHTGRIIDARQINEMESSRLKKISQEKYIHTKDDKHVKRSAVASSASDSPQDIFLDEQIGQAQYLVRFRARAEGRKVAVQQWLYLEEHPIMVGVNIVWAKLSGHVKDKVEPEGMSPEKNGKKGSGCTSKNDLSVDVAAAETTLERRRRLKQAKSRFRPAQIFLRTALEMMHVDDIHVNSIGDDDDTSIVNAPHSKSKVTNNGDMNMSALTLNGAKPNAVALFFGKRYQCIRVNLADQKCKPAAMAAKKPFVAAPSMNMDMNMDMELNIEKEGVEKKSIDETQKESNDKSEAEKRMEYEISILGKTFDDLSVVDFHCPPIEFREYLQVLKGYDDYLVHTTTCALLEEEEQRRVLMGHNA